ncbi:uncharacterized protein BHQ10_002441 [Talaromyces amestolkiae]|uniref:Dipeptidyl-peptidase V n=1 Tax=Talaromyces amestolkiae TaxID=1196081 RepID=A0A364KSA4_TALAM|nr:uncharacterized protein BHQ10_002441 [Talaromyces amestolkiae]RAO66429.1 hypothetical protein BHQ10_002441 [Talaromyces amestolkiae]
MSRNITSQLLDLELPTSVKLSPDGQSVVYSAKSNWKKDDHISSIWIGEINSPKSAYKLLDGTFNDYEPRWAPDGQSIAFLSDRGARGKSCAIYTHHLNSSQEPKALTAATNTQTIAKFEFSPDGNFIAFLVPSEEEKNPVVHVWNENWIYTNLKLLDVRSGDIRLISANSLHVVDFSWSEDGSQIAYATHRSPDIESEWLHGTSIWTTEIVDTDVQSRKVCHIPREVVDINWLNSELYFIGFSTLTDDNSARSVYYIDMQDPEGRIIKAAHGDDDCAEGLRRVGSKLLVYVQKGMEDQLRLLDSDIIYKEKKCILAFDAIMDTAGKIWVAFVQGSVNRPQEVFEFLPAGELIQLSDHGRAWTTDFCTRKFIECPTLDGSEKIEGMFISPIAKAGQKMPTVVLLHGGPYLRVTDSFDFLNHFFMPRLLLEGFGILLPNYRGSCGRGDKFARYTTAGVGVYDAPDIIAMTQHAINLDLADPSRLLVAGKSQGGFLSYLLSVRNGAHGLGWHFKAAIATAGVTDWDAMAMSSDIGYIEAGMAGGAPWRLSKSDVKTRSGSALWEFRDAAEKERIPPILLIHGENDIRVPVSQAIGFRRALEEAGLEFQCAIYRGEGHYFQKRASAEDLVERIVRFITKYLV